MATGALVGDLVDHFDPGRSRGKPDLQGFLKTGFRFNRLIHLEAAVQLSHLDRLVIRQISPGRVLRSMPQPVAAI